MNVTAMLRILVADWQDRLTKGTTKMSLAEVVECLGGEMSGQISNQDSPERVASVIEMDLAEQGAEESALEVALQYEDKAALLREVDLLSLMQDL